MQNGRSAKWPLRQRPREFNKADQFRPAQLQLQIMEPQLQSTPVSRIISTSHSFSADSASDAHSFIKDELVGSGVCGVEVIDSFLAFAKLQALWDDPEWKRRLNKLKLDRTQTDLRKDSLKIRGSEIEQYRPFHRISSLKAESQQHPPREISFIPLGKTPLPVTQGYADGEQVVGKSPSAQPEAVFGLKWLSDFDVSKEIGTRSGALHWTATIPFMATDLLRNPNAVYKVGFDAEALVWTLLWIVRVYTKGEDKHAVPNHHPLARWSSSRYSFVDFAGIKEAYLRERADFTNEWYKELASEIGGLMLQWASIHFDVWDRRHGQSSSAHAESLYGDEGLKRIETWMEGRCWSAPKKACSCEPSDSAHCQCACDRQAICF